MDFEKILVLKLTELGFSNKDVSFIFRDWDNHGDIRQWRRDQENHSVTEPDLSPSTITVEKMLSGYGDKPQNLTAPFRKFAARLVELGMKPRDWPPLALYEEGVHQAWVERCGGDKKKLKEIPAAVLNAPGRGFPSTIGELLQTSLDYGYNQNRCKLPPHTEYRGREVSIRTARAKLRELGFTNEDGPFLSDCNKEQMVKKFAQDFELDPDKAEKIFEHFLHNSIGTIFD